MSVATLQRVEQVINLINDDTRTEGGVVNVGIRRKGSSPGSEPILVVLARSMPGSDDKLTARQDTHQDTHAESDTRQDTYAESHKETVVRYEVMDVTSQLITGTSASDARNWLGSTAVYLEGERSQPARPARPVETEGVVRPAPLVRSRDVSPKRVLEAPSVHPVERVVGTKERVVSERVVAERLVGTTERVVEDRVTRQPAERLTRQQPQPSFNGKSSCSHVSTSRTEPLFEVQVLGCRV